MLLFSADSSGRVLGVIHDRSVIRVKPDPEVQASSTNALAGRIMSGF